MYTYKENDCYTKHAFTKHIDIRSQMGAYPVHSVVKLPPQILILSPPVSPSPGPQLYTALVRYVKPSVLTMMVL